MDYKKKQYFCMIPFVLLNSRPDGNFKTCSEMKSNHFVGNIYKHDGINKFWNCEHIKKTRLDAINNQYQNDCEVCYKSEEISGSSKRTRSIELFHEKYKHLVAYAKDNSGKLKTMPKWWELRLSHKCNLSCRICGPSNSSTYLEKLLKNYKILDSSTRKQADYAKERLDQDGNLDESEFFFKQFYEHIDNIDYLELHGGEPLINEKLFALLEDLVDKGHSKRIFLYVHTNLTSISNEQIKILNHFKKGRIDISIDAYKRENEFIRWPSKWKNLIKNLKKTKMLHNNWKKFIVTTVTVYQVLTIDLFLNWLNDFIKKHNDLNLFWISWPLIQPNYLQLQLIPLADRLETARRIDKFIKKAYICNEYQHRDHILESVLELRKMISTDKKVYRGSIQSFLDFNRTMDTITKQQMLKFFPKLRKYISI